MAETDVVEHQPERSRYVLKRGDQVIGETYYEIGPRGELVFTHTEVDQELQEKGLGSKLIRAALDDARASTDARIVAKCPFVFKFISTHPEYQDLTER
jgi:predicted GNAT family acetyltransferase